MLSPYEYNTIAAGYTSKMHHDASLFRAVAYFSYVNNFSMSKKRPLPMQKFWPLPTDNEASKHEPVKLTKEQIKAIFERHNIKPKNNVNTGSIGSTAIG